MFQGQFTSARRVDMRGRSQAEESREQMLARTRAEREARKRAKLEQRSATVLHAAWRGRRSRHCSQLALRQEWVERYGERGQLACGSDLSPDGRFLRTLLFFVDVREDADLRCLQTACHLLLTEADAAGTHPFFSPGAQSGFAVSVLRAKRMTALCLKAILSRRADLHSELVAPAHSGAADCGLVAELTGAIALLTGEGLWAGSAAPGAGVRIACSLAAFKGPELAVFPSFRCLIAETQQGDPGATEAAPGRPVPAYEALIAGFTKRCLLGSWEGASVPELHAKAVQEGVSTLLCTPFLWQRCPSLRASAPAAWGLATQHVIGRTAIAEWLPDVPEGGKAGSALTLLGNLLEVSGAALQRGGTATAIAACSTFEALLAVLPIATLFPGEDEGMLDAEDEDEAQVATSGQGVGPAGGLPGAEVLAWSGPARPSQGLLAKLEMFFQPEFLQQLVHRVLPAAPAGEEPRPSHVCTLCSFLRCLLSLSRQVGAASATAERLVASLAFSVGLVQRLWHGYLARHHRAGSWPVAGPGSGGDALADPGWMLPLVVLCPVYSCTMNSISTDGNFPLPALDLYDPGAPGAGLVALLKAALWQLVWTDATGPGRGWPAPAAQLRAELQLAAGRLLRQLHDRNEARRFAPPEAFLAAGLPGERFSAEVAASLSSRGGWDRALASSSRVWTLLRHAPCMVPFTDRARVFQMLVSADRSSVRERQERSSMGANTFFRIRRDHIIEDGFEALNGLGEDLKERLRVMFVNEWGEDEAGVDGGGLFKDFISDLVKAGFDPRVGLFQATEDQCLYPSPSARTACVYNAPTMFEFLGRVLGKAIYEGILLELPLAGFFLKKFQSLRSNDINDLPSLDPELYKQLMFLRSYEGDVSDLCLTFSMTDSELGHVREVDLVPGGSSIAVTNENRISYIFFVANYKLNRAIAPACAAFLRGVHELIPAEWLQLFNEREIAMLISGSSEGMDTADLRAHINYAGGYHEDHPVIHAFWEVLDGMLPAEQEAFLRFVTACSRPPLLGFKYLEPQLCVQLAGSMLDDSSAERLPTASTCMNLLKLPPYKTREAMREKLLYAIMSGAGFDLS